MLPCAELCPAFAYSLLHQDESLIIFAHVCVSRLELDHGAESLACVCVCVYSLLLPRGRVTTRQCGNPTGTWGT